MDFLRGTNLLVWERVTSFPPISSLFKNPQPLVQFFYQTLAQKKLLKSTFFMTSSFFEYIHVFPLLGENRFSTGSACSFRLHLYLYFYLTSLAPLLVLKFFPIPKVFLLSQALIIWLCREQPKSSNVVGRRVYVKNVLQT